MFSKILIANRGEIACRVIATARRMGIVTVAVHSDADASARHVAAADEAVHIGPSPASKSYLVIDRIVAAAIETGAEAIHPGYGFLSENPEFVEAVAAAGLAFIGPPPSAIRAMGLKDAAKSLMHEAGVPIVPGYHGERQDTAFLEGEAEAIGYPVLIKARAGGGGRGMRLVERPEDFAAALEGARREAASSFSDPACLVEKYIESPRHIEIQVFADTQGNVVHLFERDCSLQRRHQKVIEEAPAPGMPDDVREAMGAAAVDAARAIGYVGAGTVEFIADGSKGLRRDGFWFMEMNTRLQVEHPVTEAITGLDLVELQLRIANGEPLPFRQHDLSINGHAVEARIYAEDVNKRFLPATGRLQHLAFPDGAAFERATVRIDSGVRPGDAITPFYDPMIAKLIVHGPDRATALARLAAALDETEIAGTVTNVAFLGALARHAGFARGDVDTGLIARDLDALAKKPAREPLHDALAAIAAHGLLDPPAGDDPWSRLAGYRHFGAATQTLDIVASGEQIPVSLAVLDPGRTFALTRDGATTEIRIAAGDGGPSPSPGRATRYAVSHAGRTRTIRIARHGEALSLFADGNAFTYRLPDPLAVTTEPAAAGDAIAAPMPGLVKVVHAEVGAQVEKGAAMVVVEAMKMEHTLRAPRRGIVAEILAAPGDQVADGAILVNLAPETGDA